MMRRPMTPRETLAREFHTLLNLAKRDEKRGIHQEILVERIEGARSLAVTMAQEAPALGVEKMSEIIDRAMNYGGEARLDILDRFIRKHLERQFHILEFGSQERCAALAGEAMQRMRQSMDPRAIAGEMSASHFKDVGQALHADLLETVIRESIGLDGRVPEEGQDQFTGNEAYLVARIRNALLLLPDPEIAQEEHDASPEL